jgi:rhodanese-related sulfurtransferase
MTTRTTLAAIVLALLAAPFTLADKPLTHTKDTLDVVKENLKAGKAVIVDVREEDEWKESHLAGAIHLPQSKLKVASELAELVKKLPKDKVIYTHCLAGGRSLACGEILKKQGFDVRPLKQGTKELLKSGFERGKE